MKFALSLEAAPLQMAWPADWLTSQVPKRRWVGLSWVSLTKGSSRNLLELKVPSSQISSISLIIPSFWFSLKSASLQVCFTEANTSQVPSPEGGIFRV